MTPVNDQKESSTNGNDIVRSWQGSCRSTWDAHPYPPSLPRSTSESDDSTYYEEAVEDMGHESYGKEDNPQDHRSSSSEETRGDQVGYTISVDDPLGQEDERDQPPITDDPVQYLTVKEGFDDASLTMSDSEFNAGATTEERQLVDDQGRKVYVFLSDDDEDGDT